MPDTGACVGQSYTGVTLTTLTGPQRTLSVAVSGERLVSFFTFRAAHRARLLVRAWVSKKVLCSTYTWSQWDGDHTRRLGGHTEYALSYGSGARHTSELGWGSHKN